MARHAEVVIIGGGIAGAATAYYLAKAGMKPLLLEKGRIAGEQSSRAWGFVRQQGRDPDEVPLMIEANRIWQGLEAELEADLEWVQGGNLSLAGSDADLAKHEAWMAVARDYQIRTRQLGPRELADLVPAMRGSWRGGLFTPSDGHAEPRKVTEALARKAKALGAEIRAGCAAQRIELTNGAVSGVDTDQGPVRTDCIVCAGGAWTAQLVRPLGLDLPQIRVRASVTRTAPVKPACPAGTWSAGVAFRQHPDGSVNIAHGTLIDHDVTLESLRHVKLFLPNYRQNKERFLFRVGGPLARHGAGLIPGSAARRDPFRSVWDDEPRHNDTILDEAVSNFAAMFPSLGQVRRATSWAGLIDVTPDLLPVLGAIDSPRGLIFATGFSGHGFAMGPIVGKLTAELIVKGRASLDLSAFRLSRFAEKDFAGPKSAF